MHCRGCRKRPPVIKLTDLQAVYHLPISAAAKKFNIGLTLLKKRCRDLGLKRWPYRKLKSMDKLLHSIESVDGHDPQVSAGAWAKALGEVASFCNPAICSLEFRSHVSSFDDGLMQVAKAVNEVRTHKKLMLLAPSETQIEVGIKKFRQAAYKFEFKSKRMSSDKRPCGTSLQDQLQPS